MVDLLRRNIAEYRFYLVDWGESEKKIKAIAIDQHICHGMGRGYFFWLIWGPVAVLGLEIHQQNGTILGQYI